MQVLMRYFMKEMMMSIDVFKITNKKDCEVVNIDKYEPKIFRY